MSDPKWMVCEVGVLSNSGPIQTTFGVLYMAWFDRDWQAQVHQLPNGEMRVIDQRIRFYAPQPHDDVFGNRWFVSLSADSTVRGRSRLHERAVTSSSVSTRGSARRRSRTRSS